MIARHRERLQDLHALTNQTPLFNPVAQLGLDISRQLEAGELSLADIASDIAQLECEAQESRAARLLRLLAPVDEAANLDLVAKAASTGRSFEEFAANWAQPLLHVVFTGHPTFLLNDAEADAIANAASSGEVHADLCLPGRPREAISLVEEHDQAMAAMQKAGVARDRINAVLLAEARRKWPDRWRSLRPLPFRLATWVGYDMDGRTDIGWTTSIGFRLTEKAARLAGYAAQAKAAGLSDLAKRLDAASQHASARAADFAADLSDPAALRAAADALTRDDEAKLITLAPVIAEIEAAAATAKDDAAQAMLVLAAAMRADGLGLGWIHFRVNSAQLHNAIRSRIDPENQLDLASGKALSRLRKLLETVRPLRTNFAALALETATAMRQFLAMAQIIKHIDNDAPVRMLIAECEEPQTVLSALYLARLFGIGDKVDVSPLFETESAMEHGGRFLDALLAEPEYQAYARERGRVSIQTGFSDAGRFVGQIPAALAIERLHGRLAGMMAQHKLTDVAALIFNTHGESMGRGAHPANMDDRLTYPMSLWARHQFARRGIATEMEASFQGGDGFLPFRTDALALATLTRVLEASLSANKPDRRDAAGSDRFYDRTDLSLDFYRGIRRVQRDYLASRLYARAITAFGLGLLNQTGSRKSRRQSDLAADREMNLRQIRAIPHNAVLQQLGYPVNVLAGAGTAAGDEFEAVARLLAESDRGQQLIRLVRASNALASIKSLAAYGELFNAAFWASRPYRGTEPHLENACLALAERLQDDDRTGAFRRLAASLRVDGLKLHRLLQRIPVDGADPAREDKRRSLGVLHALRLALMQYMFLRAVQVPAFSRSNDISRDDVIEMVMTLRIDEALAQLRRAFPVTAPSKADFSVDEPADYPDGDDQGYAAIQRDYIDPIEQAYALCLRITTAIANHFGAHG